MSSPQVIRVFILIDWFTPAFRAGGPIQSVHNLVQHYPKELVEFRVFTGNSDHDGTELQTVPWDQWHRFSSNTEVWYASPLTRRYAFIQEAILAWKPNTVFINGLFSPVFNFLPAWRLNHSHVVIAARGMLHPGALSQKPIKKKIYLAVWKLLGLHRKRSYHAAAVDEVQFIRDQLGVETRIYFAPNYPRVMPLQQVTRDTTKPLRLTSIALISPMKNHLIVLQQLMHVQASVVWHIYGPIKDTAYWDLCQQMIQKLPNHIQVIYHGELFPDQVEQALQHTDLFVLPSKSENFGHAIFEALSAGKPVLTSMGTPWNNLEMRRAGFNVDMDRNAAHLGTYIDDVARWHVEDWHRAAQGARALAIESIQFDELHEAYHHLFYGKAIIS